MKLILAAALVMVSVSAHASSPWAGRLDLTSLPSVGAWQSLRDANQAVGASKHLFTLSEAGHPILNISLFAGIYKPLLSDPGASARPLGGFTFAVPGSTLDWALGTKWGDEWIPNLKTGVLAAYDLSRAKSLHINPSFIGIGAAWLLGGAPK